MVKILFVCLGNICRSPLAQYVMQAKVDEAGLSSAFLIDSAATSTEALGCSIHHGSRDTMDKHGVSYGRHTARQITHADYDTFDFIVGMDESNKCNLINFYKGDEQGKISLLLDYTNTPGAIADPWYTGDFEATYTDVERGCEAFLAYLQDEVIKA